MNERYQLEYQRTSSKNNYCISQDLACTFQCIPSRGPDIRQKEVIQLVLIARWKDEKIRVCKRDTHKLSLPSIKHKCSWFNFANSVRNRFSRKPLANLTKVCDFPNTRANEHTIPFVQRGDLLPDFFNDAHVLVPECHWMFGGQATAVCMEFRSADCGAGNSYDCV